MENYSNENLNIDINQLPRIRNGRVWYVAMLPLLGLLIERYAVNIYLGVLLWGIILIASPIICIYDEKELENLGLSSRQLHSCRWFPPLYLFKRAVAARQSTAPVVMLCIFSLYALMNNGFVTALRLNDNAFVNLIKSSNITSVEEYKDSSFSGTIGRHIEDFAIEGTTEWSFSKENKSRIVTVTGKCNYDGISNQKFEIRFEIAFDGYAVNNMHINSVLLDGRKLEGENRSEFLKSVFMSNKDDSSQQAEYKKA